MTLKDFLTPIITILTLLGGMAYSSGMRDEKITTIKDQYIELRGEFEKLRVSVDRLNESMVRGERNSKDHK